MSQPIQAPDQEPIQYSDLVDYWKDLAMQLHEQLARSRAQILNRERAVLEMRRELLAAQMSGPQEG